MSAEASIIASYQRLKHLMTCFVCYNRYSSSRKPKWLLCVHHFCQQCLAEIQQKGTIKCPLCRQLQFYSEEVSIMPDVVDDLIERASTQLAKLKDYKRLRRQLEANLTKKIQMWDEKERKLEADLAHFRQSPEFNDFSALQTALALTKSQVFRLAISQDRLDFYSDFQDKLEKYLRNATNVTNGEVISWIEGRDNQITAEDFTDYYFIRALAAAIINCSIKNRGGLNMIHPSILKHRTLVLKRYVENEIVCCTKYNSSMEIRLMLAVQELMSQRKHPKGLTLDILNTFCENDLFSSCFNACSTQSVSLAFYIVSCLPQIDQ